MRENVTQSLAKTVSNKLSKSDKNQEQI